MRIWCMFGFGGKTGAPCMVEYIVAIHCTDRSEISLGRRCLKCAQCY